jgi:hypothetical protein
MAFVRAGFEGAPAESADVLLFFQAFRLRKEALGPRRHSDPPA